MTKEICDIKTISEYLNVSIPYIRRLVYSKRIPHYRMGNRIKFDIKEINEWFEKYKQEEQKGVFDF